jgi:hypothetical protein
MKKIIVIAISASLCACATPGQFYGTNSTNQCDGKGRVDLDVRYGDSKIDITPKIDVGQGGEIIVRLKADKGYENTKVTFDGKTANDDWLNKEMTAGNGKKQIWICVDPNQAPGEYRFNVMVDGVGTIDPRAIVIRDRSPR